MHIDFDNYDSTTLINSSSQCLHAWKLSFLRNVRGTTQQGHFIFQPDHSQWCFLLRLASSTEKRHPRDHMGALHMWSTVGPSWNCFLQHHSPNTQSKVVHLIDPIRRSFSYASKIQLQFARKKQEGARSLDSVLGSSLSLTLPHSYSFSMLSLKVHTWCRKPARTINRLLSIMGKKRAQKWHSL